MCTNLITLGALLLTVATLPVSLIFVIKVVQVGEEDDDDLYIIGAVCMAVGHKFLYSSHFVDTFCIQLPHPCRIQVTLT